MILIASLMLLFIGCTSTKSGAIREPEERTECQHPSGQIFWARVNPFAAEDDPTAVSRTGSFTGVIESIGTEPAAFLGVGSGSTNGVRTFGVRVSNVQLAELQLAVPEAMPNLAVGETISVRFSVVEGPWAPPRGFVEVRDADEALIAWVAVSTNAIDGLDAPDELVVEDGQALCTVDGVCGSTTLRGLDVTSGGAHAELGYGEMAEVGEYVVLHGANDASVANTGQCFDGFFGHLVAVAAVASARVSPSEADELDRDE